MARGKGTPRRGLRLVPPRPAAPEQAPEPRVQGLSALLRQVDDLRLTLETDLTLAASAVESGSADVAADILEADTEALRRFEQGALEELSALQAPARRRSLLAQAHAAPIVAAAALVGVLVGVVPQALRPTEQRPSTTVAASDSLERLQHLAEEGDAAQVRAASVALHAQLASVVANAKKDPAAAQTALLLLTYEQSAIVRSGDSSALADVLQQSRALARAIVAALPKPLRTAVPPRVDPAGTTATAPSPSPSAKPKPKASPTAAAKPKSSPAEAKPSPSPSKSDGYPLPSPPITP